jgi:transposase
MTSKSNTPSDIQFRKVDRRGHVRTSPEYREAILDQFERSGLSGAQFAAEHNINLKTFGNWVRRRRGAKLAKKKDVRQLSLKPVVIDACPVGDPHTLGFIKIELPGEARIELVSPDQVSLVAELLRALNQPSPC